MFVHGFRGLSMYREHYRTHACMHLAKITCFNNNHSDGLSVT